MATSVGKEQSDYGQRQSTSNPTRRVVAVLNHLAANPDQAFGPSELARELSMPKSTCLAVLTTLADAGYLIQHPSRRDYRLGPAVITAGRAALARYPDLSAAHNALAGCAARLDMPLSVSMVADDQIVVIEVLGRSNPFGGAPRAGVRVPFEPPYGSAFIAWSEPDVWERWTSLAPRSLTDEEHQTLRRSVESARRRGFLVSVDLPVGHPLHDEQEQMRHSAVQVDPEQFDRLATARLGVTAYLLDEIQPGDTYRVGLIHVPVLPPPKRDPLTLTALAFGRDMTGIQLAEAGQELKAVARHVAEVCS